VRTEEFRERPFLGILRGIKPAAVEPLVESVLTTALPAIEITMNTVGAADLIRRAARRASGRLSVGAGTVLTLQDLDLALDAGAEFIVSPTLVPAVVEACVSRRIPVFPGALTPQEIYAAHLAGATMVKLFPAKFFGPDYVKEIKGPFQEIALMACGGVDPQNVKAFFANGASAVAFGASIFRPDWLKAGEFDKIRQAVDALIDAA
jgi:2-dehydro-3-deoxyphosphogluconate aldolase/(4S)-4-hydroxy-2-oxoglutarate aldolase